MIKISIIIIIAILVVATVAINQDDEQQKRFDGDKVFRLFPANLNQLRLIYNLQQYGSSEDYDFWIEPPSIKFVAEHAEKQPHPVDVRVSAAAQPAFLARLTAAKLPFKVLIKDVQKLIDNTNIENAKKDREANRIWRTSGGKVPRSVVRRFADYDEIVNWLNEQCQAFPKIATCHELGYSFENRSIRYIRLSLPGSENYKKQAVFIEAGMHAREWLSPATAVYIIDRFLKSTSGTSLRKLLESLDWYILPVANPDGYQFSRTRHRMWRKTRSTGLDRDGFNCYGVDANRNFDFHWSRYGSSYSRCSELFHGSSALSEPETRAIADFVMAHRTDLLAFISLHAYSQFWLVPYGHNEDEKPHDLEELTRVALIGTKALKRVSLSFNNNEEFDSEWQCGNSLSLLQYAVSGSSMDWAKGVANVTYSYALELRPRDDPTKQDYNGFIARESDIEKSGIEVLAGLTAAVNAMLEKTDHDYKQKISMLMPLTTQPTNEAEPAVSLTSKVSYAFSSLATWLISIFRREK